MLIKLFPGLVKIIGAERKSNNKHLIFIFFLFSCPYVRAMKLSSQQGSEGKPSVSLIGMRHARLPYEKSQIRRRRVFPSENNYHIGCGCINKARQLGRQVYLSFYSCVYVNPKTFHSISRNLLSISYFYQMAAYWGIESVKQGCPFGLRIVSTAIAGLQNTAKNMEYFSIFSRRAYHIHDLVCKLEQQKSNLLNCRSLPIFYTTSLLSRYNH